MMSFILMNLFLIPIIFFGWWLLTFFMFLVVFIFFTNFMFGNYYMNLSYSMGGDLLSMSLILLTMWISVLMIMASYMINKLDNYKLEFIFVIYFLMFFLFFTFMVMNIFYFYLFFEMSLISTLMLIFGWGYQPERISAGYYLLFYTLFASLPLLIAIFFVYNCNSTSFYFLICLDCNFFIYLSFILAFLVKMPMVFFHYWLPKAHVEAPISGSMILAGLLLKLGGYGLIRVFGFIYSFGIFYNYMFISLSMYGMFLMGMICLYQYDMKSLIAYSSVSHMSLVLCGIFSMSYWGFCGSLIFMISHGLCSSGLFFLANLNYERFSSRSLYIGSGLINFVPSVVFFWFLFLANNMSSPPSLNLFGEVILINSLVSWDIFSMLFLSLGSFFSCCYSIYLYSVICHGLNSNMLKIFGIVNVREYMVLFFHLLPLNFLFLSLELLYFVY